MLLSLWRPPGRRRILGAGDPLFFGGCWDRLGKRFLPWLGAEGLWLQLWAEGPVTTGCCSLSWLWSHSVGLGAGVEQLGLPVEVDADVAAFFSSLQAAGLLVGIPSQELLGWELLDLDLLQLLELLELELAIGLFSLAESQSLPDRTRAQQLLGLLAALAHNDTADAADQWHCVLTEERLQYLDQHLHIWTLDGVAVQDAALYVLNQPPPVPVHSLQPLAQPGLHGIQEMKLLSEHSCPLLRLEATHRLWPCSPLISWG